MVTDTLDGCPGGMAGGVVIVQDTGDPKLNMAIAIAIIHIASGQPIRKSTL